MSAARTRAANLARLVRQFVAHNPAGTGVDLALTIVLGGIRGVSVALLIPLLAVLGLPGTPQSGALPAVANVFFDTLGLPRSLPVVLLLYVALVVVTALLTRYQQVLHMDLRLGYARRVRFDVYDAVLRADWRFLTGSRRSDFMHVLAAGAEQLGHAAALLLGAGVTTVMLGVYVIIALLLSPLASLVAAGAIGLLLLLQRSTRRAARDTGSKLNAGYKELYGFLTDHLGGLLEIRSYGVEERSHARMHAALQRLDHARLDFQRTTAATALWMSIGPAAILATIAWLALEVLMLPLGELLLLVFVFSRMLPLATALQAKSLQLLNSLGVLDEVEDLLRAAREAAEPLAGSPLPTPRETITFDDVSFGYEPDRPIVAGLTFEVPVRATTAIIGPTGAGKTTTILLLAGLLDPDRGSIHIDGCALTRETRAAWRQRVAFVPQETFLLHDTVRENLRLAVPDATEGAMWDALEVAGAATFVRALPLGLDTLVGDRGARLSGGERQRIALARAFLTEPDVLVLDEATSSVDVATERRIHDALAPLRGRLTVVLITHRLSSLTDVDRVIRMEDGRVVEARVELAAGS